MRTVGLRIVIWRTSCRSPEPEVPRLHRQSAAEMQAESARSPGPRSVMSNPCGMTTGARAPFRPRGTRSVTGNGCPGRGTEQGSTRPMSRPAELCPDPVRPRALRTTPCASQSRSPRSSPSSQRAVQQAADHGGDIARAAAAAQEGPQKPERSRNSTADEEARPRRHRPLRCAQSVQGSGPQIALPRTECRRADEAGRLIPSPGA